MSSLTSALHAIQLAIQAGTLRPDSSRLSQRRLTEAALAAFRADLRIAHPNERFEDLASAFRSGELRFATISERISTGKILVSDADIRRSLSVRAGDLYTSAPDQER